jgi:hypothetical protein
MTGQPGRSGGKREGAGRPPGITGPGTGRPKGAHDVTLSPARIVSVGQKWRYAERALQYAYEMLDRMVYLARHAESEAVRLAAQDKILDRAMGKAPQHIDTSAVRHTEIVYRSAEEIRQELLARGVPKVLLDYTPPAPEPSADSDKP